MWDKSWKAEAIKPRKCGQQSLHEGKIIWAKTWSVKNLEIEKWSLLPGLSGLSLYPSLPPCLSFFPSYFSWTKTDRKKAGQKGAISVTRNSTEAEQNGPLGARTVMRWVQCHGDTNHLETQSGCAKVRKQAQRTMESCRKGRGSPACSQLWIDKKFYKSEEGDNEGLYYNKRLCINI